MATTRDQALSEISSRVSRLLTEKGETVPELTESTALLGGTLGIDSLDLAVLVVELEGELGHDPFKNGFINFSTIGELADLYVV
jgi:acyl carrier protein